MSRAPGSCLAGRRPWSLGGRAVIASPAVMILVCVLILAWALPGDDKGTPGLVFTQIPCGHESHGARSRSFLLNRAADEGSRIAYLQSGAAARVLTEEFAAAADPSVSFDGKHVLFAGKRLPQDPWNIWEMDIDGRNKRQLTRGLGNCREPEYLARSSITPPDFADKVRWITFVSDGAGVYREGSTEAATSLYATNTEPIIGRGTVVWRTTFNLSSDFSPTVLQDGRILFTSMERSSRAVGSELRYPLLAANWDGTGLNLFCGDDQGAVFKTMAAETADRFLVFVESPDPSRKGGRLARVSFRRPLRSWQSLSKGEGSYLYPCPLADGRLLTAYASGAESYGLYYFDFQTGAPGEKVFDDPRWEDIDAQPVVARPEPQGLISSVVERLGWGDLYCINVYESDRPGAGLLKRGDVKRVRFVTGTPARLAGKVGPPPKTTPEVQKRFLGEAPVEPDGSFFVRLPGDTPFYLETLDQQGRVLQSMTRWIWVRRGTSRGCIGCHENKELAPENRVPDAVKRGRPDDLRESK